MGNYNPKYRQGYGSSCCLISLLKYLEVAIIVPFVITWTQFLGCKYKFWARVRAKKNFGDVMGHLFPQLSVSVHKFFCFPFIISFYWVYFLSLAATIWRAEFGWSFIMLVLALNAMRCFIGCNSERYVYQQIARIQFAYKFDFPQVFGYSLSDSLFVPYFVKYCSLCLKILSFFFILFLSVCMATSPSFKDVVLNTISVVNESDTRSLNPNLIASVGEEGSDALHSISLDPLVPLLSLRLLF